MRIESLLSARLFVVPQIVGQRLYFYSNLSGHFSLYAMNIGGSVPEPLLPPNIALQNPHLVGGLSYKVLPELAKILVMIDRDGDENYQPMFIPLEGGFPEPAFESFFADYRVHMTTCDSESNIAYFSAESRREAMIEAYQADLASGSLIKLKASPWGAWTQGHNEDHSLAVIGETYTAADDTLFLWSKAVSEPKLLYGTPLEARTPGQVVSLLGSLGGYITPGNQGFVFGTALFSDTYGLGYIYLTRPEEVIPITISGLIHSGSGEMTGLQHLNGSRYTVQYNIDGCDWLYEGTFDEEQRRMNLEHVLVGQGVLSNGVLESYEYDKASDRFALSYSTATSPTQIYTISSDDRQNVQMHTGERILGIPQQWLSPGEDASYTSFDGTRISARLYLPSRDLNFQSPRPLVYYVHGGPQSQERPDFAWFSMPLIQFLTLNGFAVFVPNVRGSTGYGLSYMKQIDRDWGGKDRLDHVYAMREVLPKEKRVDVSRAGVVGRSYGGYMTLTQASRHPELWSAAVDMFGPYDLLTFSERIPETWKPYFAIAMGDPVKDREFLVEHSPRTYIIQTTCPLLVIQGKNDPRVVESESHDLVEGLRAQGKQVEYLVFENEGHDVLKYENRVACYNAITEFFRKYLQQ